MSKIFQVGLHRVRNGNIMDGIDELMGDERADFIYSDPPWGQGNLRYWQTINEQMTGAEPLSISYDEFLPFLFSQIKKYAKGKIVIEYGVKWNADIVQAVEKLGLIHHGSTVCYYGSKSKPLPCDLHFISTGEPIHLTDEFKQKCTELWDLKLVKYIFEYLGIPNHGVCLDPMCGMGFTAQAAKDRGLAFRGNEINMKRLQKTIDRLEK